MINFLCIYLFYIVCFLLLFCFFFFFNAPATTEIYTLSLHDALPIWSPPVRVASQIRPLRSSRILSIVPNGTPSGSPNDRQDRKSTRLNSSHITISYAVFCLKKKKKKK